MVKQRERIRKLDQVAGLWPSEGGLVAPDKDQSNRHLAIAEVLCSMPEDSYRKLADQADSFSWFLPPVETLGLCYPFGGIVEDEKKRYVRVLYLSPQLESAAFSSILAVVAHELAHLVLGHDLFPSGPDEYNAQEAAAWKLAADWGFEQEVQRMQAIYKRRETVEKKQMAALFGKVKKPGSGRPR